MVMTTSLEKEGIPFLPVGDSGSIYRLAEGIIIIIIIL